MKSFPLFTATPASGMAGFITQEEIKDIVAYAATRHIEIIPEIDLPGHSKAIIATYPHILCDLTDYEGLSIQGSQQQRVVCLF